MTGFGKVPPGLPVRTDGTLRFNLLEVLVKQKGEWWITEYQTSPSGLNMIEVTIRRFWSCRSVYRRRFADFPAK